MTELLKWLSENPSVTLGLLIIFVIVILVAVFQGREISLGPLKIGSGEKSLPSVPKIKVNTNDYMAQIVVESLKQDTQEILLLSSGLRSRDENPAILKLQDAWASLKGKVVIKVLARQSDENIGGACELLSRGVNVKFVESTGVDFFSFHVFMGKGSPRIILNKKDPKSPKQESPIMFQNIALAHVMENYFNDLWGKSTDLSEILSSKAYSGTPSDTSNRFETIIQDIETVTGAPTEILENIRFRVSLLSRAKFIFIIGLPGAGKTALRTGLKSLLAQRSIQTRSWTDYPILYEYFLREQLSKGISNSEADRSFRPDMYGGFEVINSAVFGESIQVLKDMCLKELQSNSIVIIEFARSNCLETLESFGQEIGYRSQVIYVRANEGDRIQRIKTRSGIPSIHRDNENIIVVARDDHYISERAVHRLYKSDDFDSLQANGFWSKKLRILNTNIVSKADLNNWIVRFFSDIQYLR